ncbi:hypothetical protein PPERSA_07560 [Pseudocohnilembus persalinus]|uniref:DUF1697 domain-containing protein n=1 Tax=Pseudocohnilembus persalinus TaxID=266149 RepID=A0A0V0QZV1_PSEPJ|nr:hypothetical protein PPERSA_07560 [Pseudocohnilembus persalinus]|eukprot:KRX07810.1 hypothetical protein PPERSA_07560 [Pseudocohnilembus persalinus]
MEDLRKNIEELNLKQVKTYIQTGNIVFKSDKNETQLKELIQNQIKQKYNFEVTTIVIKQVDLVQILQKNPFLQIEKSKDQQQNKNTEEEIISIQENEINIQNTKKQQKVKTVKNNNNINKKTDYLVFFEKKIDDEILQNQKLNLDKIQDKFEINPIFTNILYLKVYDGYGATKLNINFFEKQLKIKGTVRNLNTCQKVIEMLNQIK